MKKTILIILLLLLLAGSCQAFAPDNPALNSPENGGVTDTLDVVLNVTVTDPDGDTMNVYFYNAENDKLLGSELNVASGESANYTWYNREFDTSYTWYAVADDGKNTNQSANYYFRTTGTEGSLMPINLFITLIVIDIVLILFTFISKYFENVREADKMRPLYMITGILTVPLSFGLSQFATAGIRIDGTHMHFPYLSWFFWPLGAIMLMVIIVFVIEWGMSINQKKREEKGLGGDWREPF